MQRVDGGQLGAPLFVDFLEQLCRMRDQAAPGSDGLQSLVWRHAPHWLKRRLFELFIERFKDIEWETNNVDSWEHFELRGIPKYAVQETLLDFRWLGILDHLCKMVRCHSLCGDRQKYTGTAPFLQLRVQSRRAGRLLFRSLV